MKKFLVLSLAIVAVITSAFTAKTIKKESNSKQVSLYWFIGNTYTGRHVTHATEVPLSICPETGNMHCENGYDANDFVITGDPTSGLKAGATINDFLRKP